MEENEVETKKTSRFNIIIRIIIILSIVLIVLCSLYLYNSYRLLKKYDTDKFMLKDNEIATLNGVLKKNRKLIYASEGDVITLKYDIEGMTLNQVYEYLSELSSEGFAVINLEDNYIRIVNEIKDIQVRIKMTSNHLVFEYNIGIDKTEKTMVEKDTKDPEKKEDEETSEAEKKTEE